MPHEGPNERVPDYHDFCIYRDMKKHVNTSFATSIIEFGMNPGMVSCFIKQAIKEVVKKDTGTFVSTNRDKLQSMIDCGEYAKAAQQLKINTVHISDIDTTELKFPYKAKTIYSTWNIDAFYDETTAPSEMSLGTDIKAEKLSQILSCYNPDDGSFISNNSSILSPEQSYSPYGKFVGYIVPHEEIYTIARFLSIYKKDKLVYKPSVCFVYLPCLMAIKGLFDGLAIGFKKMSKHLVEPEDIANGGEAVGIVIDGKNFQTRYFGNKLEAPIEGETPTILQVSVSAFAAFRYMLDNPNRGFLFPEEVDDEQILRYARPYLKKYISLTFPSLERTFFKKYQCIDKYKTKDKH